MEDIRNLLEEKLGNTFIVRDIDLESHIVTYKHNCGCEMKALIGNLLNTPSHNTQKGKGGWCIDCDSKRTIPKLIQEFGTEYEITEEPKIFVDRPFRYQQIILTHRSNECNYHTWPTSLNTFCVSKTGCPACRTNRKYLEKLFSSRGNEYICIGPYEHSKKKIRVRHNIEECMYEWDVRPDNLLNYKGHISSGCPKCAIEKKYHPNKDSN